MITQQDLVLRQLQSGSDNTTEFIIRDLIRGHDTREMIRGTNYYHNENEEIKHRQIYYFDEAGQRRIDHEAINHRVSHNWHKMLVDQKVSYLLGRPVVINAEDAGYAERVNGYLDEEWDDTLQELGKESSNKGIGYLHPYIDDAGEFSYVVIPREQCIPVYDTDFARDIVFFIRYYPVIVNGRERLRAEWWDEETVTYYIQNDQGLFEFESPVEGEQNPASHFTYNGQGFGWGKVPFVEFRNNEEGYGDLKYYRDLIDIYDLITSDMANDITGIQKMIYVLKGYEGTSLKEFMDNLRYYRAIKVDGQEGGVDTLSVDIPVTAIDSFLDRAEENIFLFGQGVNVKTDRFGNSPSGIALKFLYGLLDLKVHIMARKFNNGIMDFLWFLTEYLGLVGELSVNTDQVLKTVSVTFSKSLLINDLELVQMAQASKGIVSDDTIIANHPWVEDAGAEKKRLEEQQGSLLDLDAYEDEDDES